PAPERTAAMRRQSSGWRFWGRTHRASRRPCGGGSPAERDPPPATRESCASARLVVLTAEIRANFRSEDDQTCWRGVLTAEPRVGIEPTTFSLRVKCSTD